MSAAPVTIAKPAATSVQGTAPIRRFDLTGTSIKRWETKNADNYSGPLDELLSLGIVKTEHLPPEGKKSISWCKGVRLARGRSEIDETYVRVWLSRNGATIGLGVSKAIQQERRRARDSEDEQYRTSLEAKNQQQSINALARVPRSKDAFLREEARTARIMMMVAAKSAAQASAFHGFHIDSESMEEIQERIDAVVEAFLNAQVQFDARRQAEVIGAHQRKIVNASPSMQARVRALTKADPSVLRGEAA